MATFGGITEYWCSGKWSGAGPPCVALRHTSSAVNGPLFLINFNFFHHLTIWHNLIHVHRRQFCQNNVTGRSRQQTIGVCIAGQAQDQHQHQVQMAHLIVCLIHGPLTQFEFYRVKSFSLFSCALLKNMYGRNPKSAFLIPFQRISRMYLSHWPTWT